MSSPEATMSFEQYSAWCLSRTPGYHGDEEAVASANTEVPASSDACPVTVRSSRDRVIVTPRIKRSF